MSKLCVTQYNHLVRGRRHLCKFAFFGLLLLQACGCASAIAAQVHQSPITTTKVVVTAVEAERQIRELMNSHLFNPALLHSDAALQHFQKQQQLASECKDLSEFVARFNQLWRDGPWSHVQLNPRRIPAAQMATFVDNMDAGSDAVQLNWIGEVPVLTVNTMMGKDTIQYIQQAYVQLQQSGAKQLIIDLRSNKGGAFAVKPLVAHLISEPLESGVFVSRRWYEQHKKTEPNSQEINSTPVLQLWDMHTFWQALTTQPLVRIQFSPEQPVFSGQVWLLTSHKTASAAEMAVAALQQANRVTVIGEQTAGEMLSQSMFDLPGDLQLSLPIATYISNQHGLIEGNGLVPDVNVPAKLALQQALALANRARVSAMTGDSTKMSRP